MDIEEEKVEDPFTDYEVVEKQGTVCEHYYCEDPKQDPNSDMLSVVCTKCPSGVNITKNQKIIDGKIVNG